MDTLPWHIYRAKPGHEVAAATICGAPAYVPRKLVKYYNRRMRAVIVTYRTMFPGYVFIQCASPRQIAMPPRKEYYGWMRNGDRSYAFLNDRTFNALCRLEASMQEDYDVVADPEVHPDVPASLRVGGKLEFQRPILAGLMGIVEEIRGDMVLAKIMDSPTSVWVHKDEALAA